jgi:hypothetical protein
MMMTIITPLTIHYVMNSRLRSPHSSEASIKRAPGRCKDANLGWAATLMRVQVKVGNFCHRSVRIPATAAEEAKINDLEIYWVKVMTFFSVVRRSLSVFRARDFFFAIKSNSLPPKEERGARRL